MITTSTFKTPFGALLLGSYQNKLCLADWRYRRMRSAIDKRIQKQLGVDYQEGTSDVIEKTKAQLEEYFDGKRTLFDVPLLLIGTDFQKSVWEILLKTPFGKTITYSQIAKSLNKETAIRAVGAANGANCLSIIVPCHRVVGSDGSLVGYAGGKRAKKKLLELENTHTQIELSL